MWAAKCAALGGVGQKGAYCCETSADCASGLSLGTAAHRCSSAVKNALGKKLPCIFEEYYTHLDKSACKCNTGYEANGMNTCKSLGCASGFRQVVLGECVACEVGKFQNASQHNEESCLVCPAHSSTLAAGSTSGAACVCGAGYTGPNGGPCAACAAGTFKGSPGSSACEACGEATDSVPGADRCYCKPGFTLSAGACVLCPANYYKDAVGDDACSPCMPNKVSTTGADDASDCTCMPGYGAAGPGNECAACGVGFFKAVAGDVACEACGAGGTTVAEGAFSASQCIPRPGYTSTGVTNVFGACPADTFKVETGEGACQACPQGSSTQGLTAQTAITACECVLQGYSGPAGSVCACSPGYYSAPAPICLPCLAGSYCTGGPVETAVMQACPANSFSEPITKAIGACVCNAGHSGPGGGPCVACVAGKYKTDIYSACLSCPADSDSPLASTASEACLCNAGFSGSNGQECSVCGEGTYKTAAGSAPCSSCPAFSLSPAGSTAAAACACNAGYTGPDGGECSACAIGKYKESAGSAPCAACLSTETTVAVASTSPSACVCPPGSAPAEGLCAPCSVGAYKPSVSTEACTLCAADETTGGEGGVDESACICNAGYSWTGGVCGACLPGTYKTLPGDGACTACGVTPSTSPPASVSYSACECNAGYTGDADSGCEACAANSYKPSVGPDPCVQCPANSVSPSASTEATACQCSAGFAGANGGECTTCIAGKFSAQGSAACSRCTANAMSPEGSTLSTDCVCVPGFTGEGGCFECGGSCAECPADTYNPSYNSSCTPCAPNSFAGPASEASTDCRCNAGFYGPHGGTCEVCPANTYRNSTVTDELSTASACTECPEYSTSPPGSLVLADCVCDAGFGRVLQHNWLIYCEPCPANGYCPDQNTFTACPLHSESPATSSAATDCRCSAGHVGPDGGECAQCPPDTYKDSAGAHACTPCTDFSTAPPASQSVHNCTCDAEYHHAGDGSCDRICAAGFEATPDETKCAGCQPGYYKPERGDGACTRCPPNALHQLRNQTSVDACYCAQGYLWDADTKTCHICADGTFNNRANESRCFTCSQPPGVAQQEHRTFKMYVGGHPKPWMVDVDGDGVYETGPTLRLVREGVYTFDQTHAANRYHQLQIRSGSATGPAYTQGVVTTGSLTDMQPPRSDSKTVFTVPKDAPSVLWYVSLIGSASTAQNQLEISDPLLPTVQAGSNTFCPDLTNAPPGYRVTASGANLEPCPSNHYNNGSLLQCTACPSPSTFTAEGGLRSVLDCACMPGYERVEGECVGCQRGSYKPEAGDGPCTTCPAHSSTHASANTAPAACLCEPAHSLQEGACDPCAAGGEKHILGNDACIACGDTRRLAPNGVHAESSCECVRGYYEADRALPCEPCALGTFKDAFGSEPCVTCGQYTTTLSPAADNRTDCRCAPLYEAAGDGGPDLGGTCVPQCAAGSSGHGEACEDCAFGTYKPEIGPHACTACPPPRTASRVGSVATSNCSCGKGFMGLDPASYVVLAEVGGWSAEDIQITALQAGETPTPRAFRLQQITYTDTASSAFTVLLDGLPVLECEPRDCQHAVASNLHGLRGTLTVIVRQGSPLLSLHRYTRRTLPTPSPLPAWWEQAAAERLALEHDLDTGDYIFGTHTPYSAQACAACPRGLACLAVV